MALEKIVCSSCGSTDFEVKGNDIYVCNYCKSIYKYSSGVSAEIAKMRCKICDGMVDVTKCACCNDPICSLHFNTFNLKGFPNLYEKFCNYRYCPECWKKLNKQYSIASKIEAIRKYIEEKNILKGFLSFGFSSSFLISFILFVYCITEIFDMGFQDFFIKHPIVLTSAIITFTLAILLLYKSVNNQKLKELTNSIDNGKLEIEKLLIEFSKACAEGLKTDSKKKMKLQRNLL